MPAAAADAPTGNHHVFAMKKYVLMKVISQMTARRTRPIARDPRVGFSAFPTEALLEFSKIREVGDGNRGEYITGFSERKRLLESLLSLSANFLLEMRPKFFFANTAKTH
jgi:hypothetical protein